jgi:hypothetical protein
MWSQAHFSWCRAADRYNVTVWSRPRGNLPLGCELLTLLLNIFHLNCAAIMSDDEERYNVSVLSYFNRMMLIGFSLKARPGGQQRYLAKDIFGSDSELSDAPDAEGK